MKLFPEDHETIVGTARMLRAGEISCQEVLRACLDRIDQMEPAVRAWVLVDREGAEEQGIKEITERMQLEFGGSRQTACGQSDSPFMVIQGIEGPDHSLNREQPQRRQHVCVSALVTVPS